MKSIDLQVDPLVVLRFLAESRWKPATYCGKPIEVSYTMPLRIPMTK